MAYSKEREREGVRFHLKSTMYVCVLYHSAAVKALGRKRESQSHFEQHMRITLALCLTNTVMEVESWLAQKSACTQVFKTHCTRNSPFFPSLGQLISLYELERGGGGKKESVCMCVGVGV